MSAYHRAAYTLDPTDELPDEPAPAAGHDSDQAETVAELHAEHKEAVQAEEKAAAEKADEWRERDPKPKPSELLAESGREPSADEDEDNGKAKKSSSKKDEKSKKDE